MAPRLTALAMALLTTDLDPEQIRSIVHDLDAALQPVGFVRLPGGNADVYRIQLSRRSDALALKIYGDEPSWIVAKEALVAGWIGGQAGISIPDWLRTDERRVHIPYRFALMTWLPGVTMRSLIGTPGIDAAYRQMGALLRRLHAISMTAYGYIVGDGILRPQAANVDYMHLAFEAAFRQFRDLGGDAGLAERLAHQVQVRSDVLAHSAGPVLCHDDFQQGNVLAARGEAGIIQLTGLLDFGNARVGDALFDLAKALMCCTHEDPTSRDALLAGYGALSHPAPAEALWLYTLFHRVTMWTFLVRLGLNPVDLLRDLDEMSKAATLEPPPQGLVVSPRAEAVIADYEGACRECEAMTTSEIIDLAQLQRTVIIGNGGSGKSRLAHELAEILEVPAIDLDEVHWEGNAYGSRRDEKKARDMVAEAAAKSAWIIEGVYGWLARGALPRATVLIWLDIPWEECRAGLMARGLRRAMTDRDHAALVAWAAEYWTRNNANSHGGHLRLFEGFGGAKLRFTERSQVDQFVSAVGSMLGRRSA